MTRCRMLSGATLKIIACLCMLIDHAGLLLFDDDPLMRGIGRLAFPLFAFLFAEGCRYTKNRIKHLLLLLSMGITCEAVYILAEGRYYGNILLTFSLSVMLICLWQEFQKHLFDRRPVAALFGAAFVTAVVCAALFTRFVGVDYGFAGVMTAVVISFAHDRHGNAPPAMARWYSHFVRLLLLTAALVWLIASEVFPFTQEWCLLAVPLAALYNGKAGNKRLKYVFYIFYPLHLAVLQAIAWVMK